MVTKKKVAKKTSVVPEKKQPYKQTRDDLANKLLEFVKTLTNESGLQTRVLGRAYHLSNLSTRNNTKSE